MYDTRKVEEKQAELFSVKRPFSEHLSRWVDEALPDKYDHNAFEYTGQPTAEEFQRALAFQRERGDTFLKLEGDAPLPDAFGLEASVTWTMVLRGDPGAWPRNGELRFGRPDLLELEEMEVRHYGPVYGEDFSRRNIRRLYEKLEFYGAFLDGRLVGYCHGFRADGMCCLDGLLVDEAYRHRRIATSLLAHIAEATGDVLFLHADEDDTPKDMYLQLGFAVTDRLYEYSCANL